LCVSIYSPIDLVFAFSFALMQKKQKIKDKQPEAGTPDRSARLSGHPTAAPQ